MSKIYICGSGAPYTPECSECEEFEYRLERLERQAVGFSIVNELPEEGNPSTIYLVPKEDGEEGDSYDEYVWIADESDYELIGSTTDVTIDKSVVLSALGYEETTLTMTDSNNITTSYNILVEASNG